MLMIFNEKDLSHFNLKKTEKLCCVFFVNQESALLFQSSKNKIEKYDNIFCILLVFPLQNGLTYVYWISSLCIIAEKALV